MHVCVCMHACVCVCVAKSVAVELRCHATALSVTKPTFVFVLETGIPAIRLSFILAERNDL